MPKNKRGRDDYPHGLVGDVVELADWHRNNLVEKWSQMVRWWKLYHSERVDRRAEHEKWRANLVVPRAFANVEAKTATMSNLILGADPMTQVEGVGDEDAIFAKGIESLLDFTMRQTGIRGLLPPMLRAVAVQGTEYVKLTWESQAHVVNIPHDPQSMRDYSQRILDAVQVSGVQPPEIATPEFELWRDQVNKAHAGKGINLPEPPKFGKQRVYTYEGPLLERIAAFDIWMDPLVDNWSKQPQIVHRVFQSKKWLEERVKAGMYDGEAVKKALSSSDTQKFSEFETEIQSLLGLQPADTGDPSYRESVELWDVFRPNDPEYKHCVVLNRSAIINSKDNSPTEMPYRHGRTPIIPIRNVVVPGLHHGVSDFQPNEWLFYELQALRNLRLDFTTIATLPTFKRVREAGGMPDLKKHFRPGSLIDVNRPESLEQLIKQGPPPASFQEVDNIKAEIDETTGTGENIRGEAATVGRISATDTQSRLNQALSRMKLHAVTFESDFEDVLNQAVALWGQYGTSSLRERITGKDPLLALSAADLERARHVDIRLRGATQAIAMDLRAQQLMMVGEKFINQMIPKEQRALLKMIWDTLSLRNAGEIISDEGTKDLDDAYQMQKAQAKAAAAAAGMQGIMGRVSGPPGADMPPGGAPGAPQGSPGAAPTPGNGAPPPGENPDTGEGPPA